MDSKITAKNKKMQDFYKNRAKNKLIKENIRKYYAKKSETKLLINEYESKRKEDVMFRITDNLSKRFNITCAKKDTTHMKLIGCTREELRQHLQSKFTEGMSFDNYSEWEVDHIKPVSLFDLTDKDQVKECFNHKNLQPLWKIDNLKKHNKY